MLPSTSSRHAAAPAALLFLLFLLNACGGSDPTVVAQGHLNRWRLDRVEASLQGVSGDRAARIRADLAKRLAHRQEVADGLNKFAAERGEQEGARLLAALESQVRREKDPFLVELIKAEMSSTEEWTLMRDLGARHASKTADRARKHAELVRGAGAEQPSEAPVPAAIDPAKDLLVRLVLEEVDEACAAQRWSKAYQQLRKSMGEIPRASDLFAGRISKLHAAALVAAHELVDEADKLDGAEGALAARQLIDERIDGYPPGPATTLISEARSGFSQRINRELRMVARAERRSALARARSEDLGGDYGPDEVLPAWDKPSFDNAGPESAQVGGDPLELARDAQANFDTGELTAARDLWRAAARGVDGTDEQERWTSSAFRADCRMQLRHEIIAAFKGNPGRLPILGRVEVDDVGVMAAGQQHDWLAVPATLLKTLVEALTLSGDAHIGFALEGLARGDDAWQNEARSYLVHLHADGHLKTWDLEWIVAAQLGENPPRGGYVFQSGAWHNGMEVDRLAVGEEVSAIVERLTRADMGAYAGSSDEPGDFELLLVMGDEHPWAEVELERVLQIRWDLAVKRLESGATIAQLGRVAKVRDELDAAREHALELIFDTEEYFYPYNPPACPPDKARLYPAVQREVDVRVLSVRDVWEKSRPVKIPASFRSARTEILWLLQCEEEVLLLFELPEDIPEWVMGQWPALEIIGLPEFAWTELEAKELAKNRAVRRFNSVQWDEMKEQDGEHVPYTGEVNQVMITNDYRILMGRRALAWNQRLQVSTRMHSTYMSDTGDFGHTENIQGRRTPWDRMHLAGYEQGVSENCHMGSSGPEGAHIGWLHSSGHHRNILAPGHREMASAIASLYWTQNFGTGQDFERELDSWSD